MTSRGLEILDDADCRLLLRSRSLGRVGVKFGREIEIFPVYYALVGDAVVFRTDPGTKLDAAVVGARVAFEVDNASPPWSVLVHGHTHEIREQHALNAARAALGHEWPAGERDALVRIEMEHVSGRRLPAQP